MRPIRPVWWFPRIAATVAANSADLQSVGDVSKIGAAEERMLSAAPGGKSYVT